MNPASPESLETRLLEQGLPRSYVRRLLEEWDSHLASRSEATMPACAGDTGGACQSGEASDWGLLGPPALLVEAATTHYRATRWAGRHPALAFLLTPVLLVCAGWGVLAALIVALISHPENGNRVSGLAAGFPVDGLTGDRFQLCGGLVVCLLAILATRFLHARSGQPGRWYRLGLVATGLVALFLCIRLVPPLGDSPGCLDVRLRPPGSSAQLLGGLLPWLCALWCATRDRLMPSPSTRRTS